MWYKRLLFITIDISKSTKDMLINLTLRAKKFFRRLGILKIQS